MVSGGATRRRLCSMVWEDERSTPSSPIGSGAVALALQGIFGDQLVQRGTTHPQGRRRARNVAAVLGEGALNEVFLKGFTGIAEPFAWGEIVTIRGGQIEIGRGDLGAMCH